jgi:acyl-coenzyme A thioesterase PaaI-like protein
MVGDVVTSQFSLNFLAPGIGEAFRAHAQVVKAGKRQVTVRVDVIAEQGDQEKLIAVAQATILPVG